MASPEHAFFSSLPKFNIRGKLTAIKEALVNLPVAFVNLPATVTNLPAAIRKRFTTDARGLTEADVDGLVVALQEDFESGSDSNTVNFLDFCKAASRRLKLVNERFRDQFQVLNEEELRETDEQFEKRKILISTFGRQNTGKSTLLNAIIGIRLLPTNWDSETSLVVYIQHDSSRPALEEPFYTSGHVEEQGHVSSSRSLSLVGHGQDCQLQACPTLLITSQKSNVPEEVTGTKAVLKKIRRLNKVIRTPAPGKPRSDVTRGDIKVNVPLLSSAPTGWDVSLVDTPGYGEDHQEIAVAVEAILKESSAFVYVMDISSIRSEADAKYLRQLYEHDKDMVTNDRLVIAVTKVDEALQADSSQAEDSDSDDEDAQPAAADRETIKERVSQQIMQLFKLDVKPKHIVVPVSATGADCARQLKHNLGDDTQRRAVIEAIEKYPSQPCGQGETLTTNELVHTLEELSGILELEDRLRTMTRRSVNIWIAKMKADYASFLKTAAEKLEEALSLTKARLDGKQTLHDEAGGKYGTVVTISEGLKKSTEEGSAVYKTLLQAYDDDMKAVNLKQKVQERLPQMKTKFKSKCQRKIEAAARCDIAYGVEELQQDIRDFSHDATKELAAVFDSECKFPNVNEVLLDAVGDMSEKYRQIRCEADALCQLLPLPSEKLTIPTPPPSSASASDMCQSPIDQTASDCQSTDSTTGPGASPSEKKSDDGENALPGVPIDLLSVRKKWEDIPKLKLTFKMLLQYLWEWLGYTSASKTEQVDVLQNGLKNLQTEVLGDCDKHFQAIKTPIVKRFYEQYHDRTMDKLKSFDEDFKDRIKLRRQKIEELEKQIDQLKAEVKELSVLCIHLPLLCNCLEEAADTTFKHYS